MNTLAYFCELIRAGARLIQTWFDRFLEDVMDDFDGKPVHFQSRTRDLWIESDEDNRGGFICNNFSGIGWVALVSPSMVHGCYSRRLSCFM